MLLNILQCTEQSPTKSYLGQIPIVLWLRSPAGLTQGYSDPRFRIKPKSLCQMQLNTTLDMQRSPALEAGGCATAKAPGKQRAREPEENGTQPLHRHHDLVPTLPLGKCIPG